MKPHSRPRGLTYIEILCAMAIGAMVMTLVLRIMVAGTQTFTREQGQAYTQFRVRTALDAMAVDIRTADAVLTSSGLPANQGAITLEVPSQSQTDILYNGTTMLKDVIAYYYTADGVLYRKTSVGSLSSKRCRANSLNPYTDVVAKNVAAFAVALKQSDGSATSDVTLAAAVDVSCKVQSAVGTQPSFTLALTGVRMRNKRLTAS